MSESDTKCGRNARTTGLPCKNGAGYKTNHPGTGACHLHGGSSSGAPKGNKNALVTGEYETIYLSALSDEERQLYLGMPIIPKEQAENNLRLICIRIHRILLRINRAQEASEDGLEISKAITHDGWNVKGKVDFTVFERTSTLETVMRLEEALTRLQAIKIRAIDQLRASLKDGGGGEDRLQNLVAAIDRSSAKIARSKPSTEEP